MSGLLKKLNGPVARELRKVLREELAAISLMTECPEHGGAYDCTPFCEICEGNQEY